MLSDVPWLTVVVPIVLLALAVLTFVLRLMGDPKPLSPANVRKPFRFVKRKYAKRQKVKDRQRKERDEQARLAQRHATFEAFRRSVHRLWCMERGVAEYHRTEWKRQIEICKRDVLQVLRCLGIKMNEGYLDQGPRIVNCEAGSIIIDWDASKWHIGRVQIVIYWHPNPSLTVHAFYSSAFPDGTIEHVRVLSKPLTDEDMEIVGWTYFEELHSDYGYGDDKWIPVGLSRQRKPL